MQYIIFYCIQELDSDKFESLYNILKIEKEKKEPFYLFMKTFDKIEEVNSNFYYIFLYSSEMK